MIYSMTAFARTQAQHSKANLAVEIRSINHRYLEVSVYLPEALRALEMAIRERIRDKLQRGKIECTVRYQTAATHLVTINETLAQQLCEASEKIANNLSQAASVDPSNILRFPGVLEVPMADVNSLQAEILKLVDDTLADLIAGRGREGDEIKQLFLTRMSAIQQELAKVRERLPQVLKDQRERMIKRFTDAKLELDPMRLEQEMVMYAQRIDVAEEIERTETHLNEFKRVLQQGGLVGRRMDFLMQELNREANTLGSKSVDAAMMHAAVEMKVLIEQMREQVQNIE